MIKTIIFDADGVLVHGPRFSDTYSQAYGISADEMIPFFDGPFQDCLVGKADLKEELTKGWLERWRWPGSVDELLNYWFAIGAETNNDLFNTVKSWKDKNLKHVLATNNEKYRTEYLLEKLRPDINFDAAFSSGSLGALKTSPNFFDEVISYLQQSDPSHEPAEMVFWDDDINNIESAQKAGIKAHHYVDCDGFRRTMREYGLLS